VPAEWIHEQRGGDMLFYSGQLMELAGNLEAARRQYERGRLAECHDKRIRAALRTRLSQIYTGEGALDQALRLAQEAAEVLPEHVPAHKLVERAERAIRLQQIGAHRGEPDTMERTLAISALLRSCGELNEAIGELQAGLSRGQTEPDVFIELAECFLETQDFNIARRAFSEVLKRIESSGAPAELKLRGLYGLASAEERLDNLPEAVRCLEQILMLRHDYRDSRERLKRLYSAQKPGAVKASGAAKAEILDEIMSMLGVPKPVDDKGKPS
jgi:tetratricopeptide (TPR) repeat protein